MPAATNQQVQTFVDARQRPRAEAIRNLLLQMEDDAAAIGDVYENVNDSGSTFADARADAPPHLATRQDVLAMNTLCVNLVKILRGEPSTQAEKAAAVDAVAAQLSVALDLCVRPPL